MRRVLERETTQLVLGSLVALLFLGFYSQNATASIKPISCETNFGERSFTIQDNTIAFHQEKESGRSISSILDTKTQRSHKGFRKLVYKDGYKHLINIKDQNNFNSNEDFLAVTSPKGHKMTYPIHCSLLD